jgi:hypothetical protein
MTNDDINAIAVRLIVLTAKHLRLAPAPERTIYITKTDKERWSDIVGEFTKLADGWWSST